MCGVRGSAGCALGPNTVVRKRCRSMVCVAISMAIISSLKTSVRRARLVVRSGPYCLSKVQLADLA
jgi:DNA gyrase inhibitor GyrI